MSSVYFNTYNFNTNISIDEGEPKYRINGIMDTLSQMEQTSVFVELIQRANYDTFLNDRNSNVTIFLSQNNFFSNITIPSNMDIMEARSFVESNMLKNKISFDYMRLNNDSKFQTKNVMNKYLLTNVLDDFVFVNGRRIIQKDIICDNGIIHIIE